MNIYVYDASEPAYAAHKWQEMVKLKAQTDQQIKARCPDRFLN